MLAVLITMPILFFVFYFLCAVKEENLHLVIQGFFQALVLYVTGIILIACLKMNNLPEMWLTLPIALAVSQLVLTAVNRKWGKKSLTANQYWKCGIRFSTWSFLMSSILYAIR
ncbi:MAG: hypothetical protein E7048_02950 [Lentisphaerae bacterium]|nr:hypothetical protein [Lentisphaerota bacterium]